MSWLTWFTGGSKAVDKGLDMIDRGVDMAIYTGEEKAIASQKILDWRLKWIDKTSPQNLARRHIAYAVVGLWIYLALLAVHVHLFWSEEKAEFIFNVLKETVMNPFSIVMSFYFIAHIVRASKK